MNRLISPLAACLAALAMALAASTTAPAQIGIWKWGGGMPPPADNRVSPAASVPEESSAAEEEQTLQDSGIGGDGRGLVAFFQARGRTEVEQARLEQLVEQLGEGSSTDYD